MTELRRSELLTSGEFRGAMEELGPETELPTRRLQDSFSDNCDWLTESIKAIHPEIVVDSFPKSYLYTVSLPDLNIHVFNRILTIPMHGMGDVCVLEKPSSGAFIVLYGETIKQWLDRGIRAFAVPGVKPIREEVEDILLPWTQLADSAGKNLRAALLKLAAPMQDPAGACRKFVCPFFESEDIRMPPEQSLERAAGRPKNLLSPKAGI